MAVTLPVAFVDDLGTGEGVGEMLEDLVLAALHEAVGKVNAAQQQSLGGIGGALGGLLGQ